MYNAVGISLDNSLSIFYSNNNKIFNNNLRGNTNQAIDATNANIWDSGYPPGGNHWDDYPGVDLNSGPNQDIPGSDGIGDTPYNINGGAGAQDRYPLMASYIGTPTPPPLVVNIITPTDNSFSEELVNFSGTASGGTPPYTYVWTSNRIAEPLGDTDELSEELPFNNIPGMNQHAITLTVQDSAGNPPATKTVILNVVKQKIKILVVPIAASDGELSPGDRISIKSLADDTKEFYLRSSYGAIYLDFDLSFNSVVSADVDLLQEKNCKDCRKMEADTLTKLEKPPYSMDLSKYKVYVIVDTSGTLQGGNSGGFNDAPFTAALVPIGVRNRLGIWVHEMGHLSGNFTQTSETNGDIIWPDPYDLYLIGNVNSWDVMARGVDVFDSTGAYRINQPTDMSILSKTKLGWLNKNTFVGKDGDGDHFVMSTENMHYNDSALVYKPSPFSNVEYYIEARELIQPSYYRYTKKWWDLIPYDAWFNLENGILIYKVGHDVKNNPDSINILRSISSNSNSDVQDPTFLASEGAAASIRIDVPYFATFSVIESNSAHPYNATIRIETCDAFCRWIEGVKLDSTPLLKSDVWSFSSEYFNSNGTIPNLDLHAVTPEGLHIGMNYTSNEYEMQIPGGIASGDMIGEEWIFVPTGTNVSYYVDSHDVQKYLEEHPEVNASNATMNYSISHMKYGENPQRVELPDGNWTVTNRTVSVPQNYIIEPGVIKEIVPEPPASITNLTFEAGSIWLNFTWLNPPDPDFHHVMLYLNGTFKTNIPAPQNYYNFTGLEPDTLYELGTHTVDSSGNVNETWVNATARTLPFSDSTPIVSNSTASHEIPDDTENEPLWGETAQLNVTVTDDSGVASVTVNLSEIGGSAAKPMTNIGGNIWSTTTNASAGTPPKIYNLTVNATDTLGNSNTSVTIPLRVMKNGDTTGNGVVTIGDALRCANNVSYPGNSAYALSSPYVADVNGNGIINIGDCLRLANNVSFPGNLLFILK